MLSGYFPARRGYLLRKVNMAPAVTPQTAPGSHLNELKIRVAAAGAFLPLNDKRANGGGRQ